MSGTPIGGKKAAQSNKDRYGEDYYAIIARKGGKASRGPFGAVPGLASRAGRLGGQASGATRQKRAVQEANPKSETP